MTDAKASKSGADMVGDSTAGLIGGGIGGAVGALAGTAVVWRLVLAASQSTDTSEFPLQDAQVAMAVVIAAVMAIILGMLIGGGLGLAFASPMAASLDGRWVMLLIVAGTVAELMILVGLDSVAAGREVGLTDFLWTAILPGLFASGIPALVLVGPALMLRHVTEP